MGSQLPMKQAWWYNMGDTMYSLGGSNEPPELAIFLFFYILYIIYIFYLTLLNKNLNTLILNFFKTDLK